MEVLDYIKIAQLKQLKKNKAKNAIKIAVVTNFTDDVLKKILTGLLLKNGLSPSIYTSPYKQYLFELKNKKSNLWKFKPDITFVFFDINIYISSEFLSDNKHLLEILEDIESYSKNQKNSVVIQTAIKPNNVQHGRLFKDSFTEKVINEYNIGIKKISEKYKNVKIIDTEILIKSVGEKSVRDLRGLYAFSQPFTNDFFLMISKEWMSQIRSHIGKVYKCIVLDLDNTLWGGIVGEVGPFGIKLGHEYPGNAYKEFQKTILDFYNKGIILAINSRNNPEDVDEVFEKNKNMVLKKSHFASILTNWNNKAENLRLIAKELNIGLDSLVFIDDDAMNRDLVKKELPEVLVPEWNIGPEEYVRSILDIDAFHFGNQTKEDEDRGKMYQIEKERKEILNKTSDLNSYLKTLRIEIDLHLNNKDQIPRLAQLTQKTNQFNLTTKRLTEKDIIKTMTNGGLIFSGDVKDKFGPYGITIVAIIEKEKNKYKLSNFLMSCRVMGRNIEYVFMNSLLNELYNKGIREIDGKFIPTIKNKPAKDFLTKCGSVKKSKTGKEIDYKIKTKVQKKNNIIKINKLFKKYE